MLLSHTDEKYLNYYYVLAPARSLPVFEAIKVVMTMLYASALSISTTKQFLMFIDKAIPLMKKRERLCPIVVTFCRRETFIHCHSKDFGLKTCRSSFTNLIK